MQRGACLKKNEKNIHTQIFIHINTPPLASWYATTPRLYISDANENLTDNRRKESQEEKQQTPHPSEFREKCILCRERKMQNKTRPNSVPPAADAVTPLMRAMLLSPDK
jgi:hypothetical protein